MLTPQSEWKPPSRKYDKDSIQAPPLCCGPRGKAPVPNDAFGMTRPGIEPSFPGQAIILFVYFIPVCISCLQQLQD